ERRSREEAGRLELGGELFLGDASEEIHLLKRERLPAGEPANRERVGAAGGRSQRTESGAARTTRSRAPVLAATSGHARSSTSSPFRFSLRPMKTTLPFRPPASKRSGRKIPFGITSIAPPAYGPAARRAASDTAIR